MLPWMTCRLEEVEKREVSLAGLRQRAVQVREVARVVLRAERPTPVEAPKNAVVPVVPDIVGCGCGCGVSGSEWERCYLKVLIVLIVLL